MENSQAILSAFESIDLSISIFSKDGHLLEMNDSAMELFGITDKSLLLSLDVKFSDDPHYNELFDPGSLAVKAITTDIIYDCDKLNSKYPGLLSKKGKFTLSLRLRPIYDKDGNMLCILAISKDISNKELDKKELLRLKDERAFMMCGEGITTWIYDIASGRRILDCGSHLYPMMEYMKDFIRNVHPEDVPRLESTITLIKIGAKIDGHAKIRIKDRSADKQYTYLEVFCLSHSDGGKVTSISFLTKDVTKREQYLKELKVKELMLSQNIKELKRSNLLLNSLMYRMPCLFFAKDTDNEFRYTMVIYSVVNIP